MQERHFSTGQLDGHVLKKNSNGCWMQGYRTFGDEQMGLHQDETFKTKAT